MYFEEGSVNGLAQTAILLKVKSVYVGGGAGMCASTRSLRCGSELLP